MAVHIFEIFIFQKEKQDILRRLNQNIKTQDSPDSDAGDKGTVWQGDSAVTSPGNGPQPEAQLEDGPHLAGERKKWEAEPPPVIPLAQLTLEDTGSEINYEGKKYLLLYSKIQW